MKFNAPIIGIVSSKIRLRIVEFLLSHEASMSEREIASILKISHMSVNRVLRELSRINFVNFSSIGRAHLWKVNRSSYAFRVLSKLIKGASGIKSPLDDLKNTLLKNLPKTLIKKAVLFGSVAKASEKIDSDIDIFLLVKSTKNKQKVEALLEKLSGVCVENYGNSLSPYILTEQEFKQKKKLNIISEINNGIEILPEMKN